MRNAVIAGYVRSPFAFAHKGAFARTRPDDLAAAVVRALVERTGVDPATIEDLIMGCAYPEAEQGFNVARIVVLLADLPISIGGTTVNRFCGSSMTAVHMAAGAIATNSGDAFICAGVESMSRVQRAGFNFLPNPALHARHPGAYIGMGDTAENVADQWGISRAEQEAFAIVSQRKAGAARADGRMAAEIVPIATGAGTIEQDACLRPETSAEGLAKLKPAFRADGTVTAGTSSPLTDGASAVLVVSEDYAREHGMTVMARIRSMAISGCSPDIMGIGPIGASRKALSRAGIEASALDVVELNEAFASQSLATVRELGIREEALNIDGGAISIGHPLGATGARLVGKAASLLARDGGTYALATQCIGGGQGIATVLERV